MPKPAITLEEVRESYAWREAITVADTELCEGATCSRDDFQVDDIVRVIHAVNGENDGDHWVGVFELADGRFAFIEAWCDYTGWDCQSGGTAWVSHSYENLRQFGMTDPAKDRFAVD